MADMDTPSKRFSIMNLSCPWRTLLPPVDGSFDQGDRQHLLYYYSGIDWSGAAAVVAHVRRLLTMGVGF